MRATSKNLSLTGAVLLAALLAAVPATALPPAGPPVPVPADIVVSGACTLADAIDSANTDSEVGSCVRVAPSNSEDTIVLTDDVVLLDRLPAVTTEITVAGNDYTVSRDPDEEDFRIFEVEGFAGDLTLDSVTVSGGLDDAGGGVLAYDEGELYLINSTVSGNVAGFGGGVALYNSFLYSSYSQITDNSVPYTGGFLYGTGGGVASSYDSLSILAATEVSGNFAALAGGGVANAGDSTSVMFGSTVSGNSAFFGGGAVNIEDSGMGQFFSTVKDNTAYFIGGTANSYHGYQYASYSEFSGNTAYYVGGLANFAEAELLLVNVTVSGNEATADDAGGLLNLDESVAFLKNTTFSGNATAAGYYGGAVLNDGGAVYAEGSLFANSTGGNCAGDPIDDAGGNLDDDGSCGFATPLLTGLDPDLAVNGSGTFNPFPFPVVDPPRTHALLYGSSAIDAAGDCGLGADQRGAPRDDGFCDSGAYEYQFMDADGDGVVDELDVCPDTIVPDSDAGVPSVRLGTNRWVLSGHGDPLEFVTKKPKGNGPGRSYTIADTAGCSCAQIIDELGLGNGHTKFGCSISAMDDWVALVSGPPPV